MTIRRPHGLIGLILMLTLWLAFSTGCVMSPAGAGGVGTRSAGNLQLTVNQKGPARDGKATATDPVTGKDVEATGAVVIMIMGNSAQLEAGKATDLGASVGTQLNSPNGQLTTTLTPDEVRAAEKLKQIQADASKTDTEKKTPPTDTATRAEPGDGKITTPPVEGAGKAEANTPGGNPPPPERETPNKLEEQTMGRVDDTIENLRSGTIHAKRLFIGGDPMNGDLAEDFMEVLAGVAGANVTAEEFTSDGVNFLTRLTLAAVPLTIGDNAALALGALIYTLPAGPIITRGATSSLALTLTTGTPKTDTPEIALGTTQGTGANATLGAVAATAEDIHGPKVAADLNGTVNLLTDALVKTIETAGAHTVYLNVADAWANVDDTAATVSGTIALQWSKLPLA